MSTFFQQFSQLLVKLIVNTLSREGCALVFWCDLFCVIELCDPGKRPAVNAILHQRAGPLLRSLAALPLLLWPPSSRRAWMLRVRRCPGNRLSLKAELGDRDGWAVALHQALCGLRQHLSLTLSSPLQCNQPNFQRRRLRPASEASRLSHTIARWWN